MTVNRDTRAGSEHLAADDFRALLETGREPIAVLGVGGVIRYASPAWAALLGESPEELQGRSLFDRLARESVPPVSKALADALGGASSVHLDVVLARGDASSSMRATLGPFRDASDRVCAVLRCRAGTGHETGAAPNQTGADHSAMSRFADSARATERLERSIVRAQHQANYTFAVLVLALDRHELITDMVGHDDRDALLVKVGERLRGAVRPGDHVSHLTGDELWVLVDQISSPEDTITIAGRIQQSLARPFDLGSEEMSITAAIGIALSGEGAGGAEDMLKNAATAMRRARARGPSRHEFYDLAMRARARDRLRLETDLRLGVERDEFVVHYQPIVTVRTGAIEGFEALVRWQHPRRGLVPPGQFIPTAEETGLIVPMSVTILQRGCAQIRAWQERFGQTPGHAAFSLSMNFTGTHFSETAVLEVVSTALQQSGLDGSCLVAEVTESILLRDVDTVLAVLDELTRMKVRVHLDDFGTGYSSLSYLHRLPVDTLKIDRSFVSRLGIDGQTDILVKAIVDLAHNLGKQVIAEGIETEEQAAIVEQLGCEFGQGYYYARPNDAKAVEALLDRCAAVSDAPDRWPRLPGPGVAGAS